ncbi:hypothetical protein F5879DRAFT_904796 [Lentinula edodes]|uniref:uncharacterized protein n=1 Tax=Lentinula edodes TaxID=5353 RepID=UPI001E8EA8B6|nr:uncharacterized protein C8R40DRAFT_1081436 [Lentinula edodes]KAH7880706.1 hypothetical protein C8R40DRAFT_1081436 [Lentinula edodes]KAJ3902092.1 hypothetical protein F5879DRAFT_904796 [Lentinula edodes]
MSSPLKPYTVSLILTYICPPSQLTLSPLSPHLISRPLLQRHHFLGLDPETDLKAYLMWATEDDKAFARLEGLAPPTAGDEDPVIGIRYTADKENIYAHAELRSWPSHASAEIRLVFLWDPVDSSWKYHNIASMPFPISATLNVTDAVEQQTPSLAIQVKGDEDDDYWNSYGSDVTKEHIPRNKSNGDISGSEDAYWAQYASVQGTADSTVPTPRRETHGEETFDDALARARGLHNKGHSDMYDRLEDHHEDQEVINISYNTLNIPHPSTHPSRTSAVNGVCPTDLSDRLNSLPPRTSLSPHVDSASPSPVNASSTVLHDDDYIRPAANTGTLKVAVNGNDRSHSLTPRPPTTANGNDVDEVTKSVIRGVHEMWKATTSQPASVDEFLRLVGEAISS